MIKFMVGSDHNLVPSVKVALTPVTFLFSPIFVVVGALSLEQIVLEETDIHIASWVPPLAKTIRLVLFEITFVALSFIVLPRSFTTLLVGLPLPSVCFSVGLLDKGAGSFKRICLEFSCVHVTTCESIFAFSVVLSIFEGAHVAVALLEIIDKVAVATEFVIGDLSDVYPLRITTFNHCGFTSVDRPDIRFICSGFDIAGVLQVTETAHSAGFPALRLGGFGPTHTNFFESLADVLC